MRKGERSIMSQILGIGFGAVILGGSLILSPSGRERGLEARVTDVVPNTEMRGEDYGLRAIEVPNQEFTQEASYAPVVQEPSRQTTKQPTLEPQTLVRGLSKDKYTIDDYIDAIIEIESSGNPNASRYEPHLDDFSFGLGQILTVTARDIQKNNPELPKIGNTFEEIKGNLLNPVINRAYTEAFFKEKLEEYGGDVLLAIASYNAGDRPRNIRYQQQLNDILGIDLETDGYIGPKTREAVREIQETYGIRVSKKDVGLITKETSRKIRELWAEQNPGADNPLGVIPENAEHHVAKFIRALEN